MWPFVGGGISGWRVTPLVLLMIFLNSSLVPYLLRNIWHNARNLGVQVISSHIFREGNYCADRLANMCHAVQGSVWLDILPA